MLPIQISVTYVRNKGISRAKIEKKYERFKRFRVKSCRSISLPVKIMASGAPRGHITTGIFSTDKVALTTRYPCCANKELKLRGSVQAF